MALTFGTDLTPTGNIKLTEVQLVQGAGEPYQEVGHRKCSDSKN